MDTFAPLLNGIRPPGNSFVLPEHKVVYISVTKVACTSLRWMVADLAGEDPETFHRATGAQQTRLMSIHGHRQRWQKVPQLFSLSKEQLAEISPENGWFVFAVVRDPWSRLWSGWQSKFLVRHTAYVDNYGDEPWFPRVPETSEEVVEDFARFVEAAPWQDHELLSQDWHFRPQVESVRPEGLNYTKVYDVARLRELFTDLHEHLSGIGKDQELYTPRANETPLPLTREVLANGVAERIRELYAADFEVYGDRWSLDAVKTAPDGWSDDALAFVAFHGVANERIGDLSRQARKYRQESARLRKKLTAKSDTSS